MNEFVSFYFFHSVESFPPLLLALLAKIDPSHVALVEVFSIVVIGGPIPWGVALLHVLIVPVYLASVDVLVVHLVLLMLLLVISVGAARGLLIDLLRLARDILLPCGSLVVGDLRLEGHV